MIDQIASQTNMVQTQTTQANTQTHKAHHHQGHKPAEAKSTGSASTSAAPTAAPIQNPVDALKALASAETTQPMQVPPTQTAANIQAAQVAYQNPAK